MQAIDDLAERILQTGATPGITLAVSDRERVVEVRCWGLADPARGKPVTPRTPFEIGSISKSFTAICLMCEWDDDRLDLGAPVASVLPWFPLADITFHHLLSHTGGLVCGTGDPPGTPVEILTLAETARSPAGERFWYSNIGYAALGYALSELTREAYPATYRRRILGPLGMTGTSPVITHDLRAAIAVGHDALHDDRPYRTGDTLGPCTWIEYAEADGSVVATAHDLAQYGRMILNSGQGVLSERAFARLTDPVADDPEEGDRYAYGLAVRERDGHRWIGHSGGMIGHHSQLWCDMDAGLAVAVFVNGKAGSDPLSQFALRALAGGSPDEPDLDFDDPGAATTFDAEPAAEWHEICGRYRSYNPWSTTVVVGTVEGVPTALHWGEALELTPLEDGSYRLGEVWSPERMRFDTVIGERAMRAWVGAAPYCRPVGG